MRSAGSWSISIFKGCEPLLEAEGELVICGYVVATGEPRESDPGPEGNAAVGLSFHFRSSDERRGAAPAISDVVAVLFCREAFGLAISEGSFFTPAGGK